MKRFIRIWGLLAFVIVTILITVTGYFLADSLIKKSIETAGTNAASAKLSHSAFPAIPAASPIRA